MNEPRNVSTHASPSDLWHEHRGDGYERTRGDDGASPRPLRPTASIAVVGTRLSMEATRADHRATEETIDQFARVALVANALTAALDASEVVDIVVRQGMAGLDAEGGLVAFLEDDGSLVPAVAVGYPPDAFARFTPMTIDRELPLTLAARTSEPVWVSSRRDAQTRFPELVARSRTATQAWAAIPLVSEGSVLGVLGVSFLAPHEFSETQRLFIGALADVSALALRRCRAREHDALQSFDTRRKQVFAATLTLARIVTEDRIAPDVAERLVEVIDDLDSVVRVLPDRVAPHQTCLCRFDDCEVFAYARGHDFIRVSDHTLWAHESDGLLVSARSGTPLARRVGKAYHDVDTNVPLYYERSR